MVTVPAMAIITTVMLVVGNGRSDTAGKSGEASLWCVSDCGTCPMVCSPPPSPPKPSINVVPSPPKASINVISSPPKASINVIPSPPEKKLPPPPPPSSSWTFSSSPYSSSPGGQERGGFSYPYYYFYRSDALKARGLLPASLYLVPWFLVLFSIV